MWRPTPHCSCMPPCAPSCRATCCHGWCARCRAPARNSRWPAASRARRAATPSGIEHCLRLCPRAGAKLFARCRCHGAVPLSDANAIPVLVHAGARDAVDVFSSLLRSNGISAQCTWIPALEDLADGLEQLNPELLVSVETPLEMLVEIASVRDQVAPAVPLIVLRDDGDQAAMMGDMLRGARDCVSLRYPERVA